MVHFSLSNQAPKAVQDFILPVVNKIIDLKKKNAVAFFMIHPRRSKEAFAALIEDWAGILFSDGFKLCQRWVELRQPCLAYLIRRARELSERKNSEIAAFGKRAVAELQRLCHMAHAPSTGSEWRAFNANLSGLNNRRIFRRRGLSGLIPKASRPSDNPRYLTDKDKKVTLPLQGDHGPCSPLHKVC